MNKIKLPTHSKTFSDNQALTQVKKIFSGKNLYLACLQALNSSNGLINSHEAFTKGFIPKDWYDLVDYIDNEGNWLPERKRLHKVIIEKVTSDACLLSKKVTKQPGDIDPKLFFFRGNSGAGKTTLIQKEFKLEKNLVKGILNPDTFRHYLMKDSIARKNSLGKIFHHQFDMESFLLLREVAKIVLSLKKTVIFDRRFDFWEDLIELIIWATDNKYKECFLYDIDIPLELSLVRILTRKNKKIDPIVPYESIVEGFKRIRTRRAEMLEKLKGQKINCHYNLYVLKNNALCLAQNSFINTGKISSKVFEPDLVREAFSLLEPIEKTIKKTDNKVITDKLINNFLEVKLISEDQYSNLKEYIGFNFKKAFGKKTNNYQFPQKEENAK